jgi:hypothetical protein
MPSTYSPDLRIELMANGEKSGTWGSITNSNLGTIIEDSIAGLANVPLVSTSQALTVFDGVYDESRNAAVRVTSSLSAALSLFVPPVTKLYVFINATNTGGPGTTVTVYASTVAGNTTAAGTGIAVPAGSTVLLRCDGVNVVEQLNTIVGDLTVKGALIATGSPTFDGNLIVQNSAFLGGAQTATINISTPAAAVITVAASPVTGAAVTFSTTGTLPTGITPGTLYYVSKINATTFNISTSPTLSPLVVTTAGGTGTHTVATISLAVTPPAASNSTQLATTEFVKSQVAIQPASAASLASTNWIVSETFANQTATITLATPAVVTVAAAPALGTAVAFTTTGALPTGITANTAYYVFNRTGTTYNLATTPGQYQTATISVGSPAIITVGTAPNNGDVVSFSTTGALPTGIVAGTNYYVINRTATTFNISATSGGSAINTSGTTSGIPTATWRTLVNTTGTQSGVQTETTSKLLFAFRTANKMSLDLGGNLVTIGNMTAYGSI